MRQGVRDRIVATETRSEGQDSGAKEGVEDRMVAADTGSEVQDCGS